MPLELLHTLLRPEEIDGIGVGTGCDRTDPARSRHEPDIPSVLSSPAGARLQKPASLEDEGAAPFRSRWHAHPSGRWNRR